MRVAGRLLFGSAMAILALLLVMLLRSSLAAAGFTSATAVSSRGAARASLAYVLGQEPTNFVFSRPQRRVRILTNVELRPGFDDPRYGFLVEALDNGGSIIWSQQIFVRSIPLFVRGQRGELSPHAFVAQKSALQPSAADATLIDFGRPAVAVRIRGSGRDPGAARIFARVQEQRPISERQLAIGWQRLSERDHAELTAGNPLGPVLTSEEERQRLLAERWHPVGPSGVDGRDYRQILFYERVGPKLLGPGRAG